MLVDTIKSLNTYVNYWNFDLEETVISAIVFSKNPNITTENYVCIYLKENLCLEPNKVEQELEKVANLCNQVFRGVLYTTYCKDGNYCRAGKVFSQESALRNIFFLKFSAQNSLEAIHKLFSFTYIKKRDFDILSEHAKEIERNIQTS